MPLRLSCRAGSVKVGGKKLKFGKEIFFAVEVGKQLFVA